MDELIEQLLEKLDAAYAEIRAVHTDKAWINNNQIYKDKVDQFNEICALIFEAKRLYKAAERVLK